MKRIIIRILIGLVMLIGVIILIGAVYVVSTTPSLPSNTDKIIDEVMATDLPELVTGQAGFIQNDDVSIWYEHIEPVDTIKGTILMLMGIGSDAIAWPEHFVKPIVEKGYRVVRLDNRGTGLSDWVKDWRGKGAYTLHDMAEDGLLIMDSLRINQFHVLGVSLGGMIAQQTAINYPDRVISLASIMSSGSIEDPELPGISMELMKEFIKLSLRYGILSSERNIIKLNVAARVLLMGDRKYDMDVKGIAEEVLYNLRNRNGYNAQAVQQQSAATSAAGSRYNDLAELTCPVLIVHGTSDPLMPFAHGQKMADMIPENETLWVEGMGHDIPELFVDTVLNRLHKFWETSQ